MINFVYTKESFFVEEAYKSKQRIEVIPLDKFLKILGTSEEESNKMPLPPIDCFLREDAVIK